MKVYKLFWTRLLGLATFLAMFLFICLIPAQVNDYVQYADGNSEEDRVTWKAVSILRYMVKGAATATLPRHRTQRDTRSTDEEDEIVADETETEDGEQYDENSNQVFQKGDFDYRTTATIRTTYLLPVLSPTTAQIKVMNSLQRTGPAPFRVPVRVRTKAWPRRNVTLTIGGMAIIEDTIFWSAELEEKMPPALSDEQVGKFLCKMKHLAVKSVAPPTWNRCGRPKNQFVTFEDNSHVCARYRTPHDYLVQGEVLSFYLSRLLAINHVPAVTLSAVDRGSQWKNPNVTASLRAAEWQDNATVALIMWVEGLERDHMPPLLLNALLRKKQITWKTPQIANMTLNQMVELLQWTNLIVFDYITGNYDRVASMQDAADKEKKVSILHETIHNLVTSRHTGSLWLIDNESGLLDSYALLYGSSTGTITQPERRFVAFHRSMLDTICLFRKPLIDRIRWLYYNGHRAARILVDFVRKYEPLYDRLPDVFDKDKDFAQRFHQRISEVYQHIKKCQRLIK